MSTQQDLELSTGPFGFCKKKWDEERKEYVDATETDVADCCLKRVKPFVDTCKSNCNELYTKDLINRCRETCNDIIDSARINCILSGESWGLNRNPIQKAFKYYNCGDARYKKVDIDCLNKHKNEIISRCVDICVPSDNVDCNKLCHYSFNFFAKPEDRVLKYSKIVDKVDNMKQRDSYVNIINNILFIVTFIIILTIVYLLIKKYTEKNK